MKNFRRGRSGRKKPKPGKAYPQKRQEFAIVVAEELEVIAAACKLEVERISRLCRASNQKFRYASPSPSGKSEMIGISCLWSVLRVAEHDVCAGGAHAGTVRTPTHGAYGLGAEYVSNVLLTLRLCTLCTLCIRSQQMRCTVHILYITCHVPLCIHKPAVRHKFFDYSDVVSNDLTQE
jgi:hypothetical protein